jgi:hypothetical protein
MSDDLKAEFDAAVASGDLPTLERVGPQLYPESGTESAPLPAPTPGADVTAERLALRAALASMNPGSVAYEAASAKLLASYQAEHQAEDQAPADNPDPLAAAGTRESLRPGLPEGFEWDRSVVGDFEERAPAAFVLEYTVADLLQSPERWHDPDATIDALISRWGDAEAVALAQDATSYFHKFGNRRIAADLKAQGLFYHPRLIRDAAIAWRQHQGPR